MAILYENFGYINEVEADGYSSYACTDTIWRAQQFTPSVSHTIRYVKIRGLKNINSTGTITVDIRATASGSPTGAVLCSGDFNLAYLSNKPRWFNISLGAGVSLSAAMYALIIHTTGNPFLWSHPTSYGFNHYSGGDLLTSTDSGVSYGDTTGNEPNFEEWDGEPYYGSKFGMPVFFRGD